MSLEALLAENTAALTAQTAILERVLLGQEAAMAKLEGVTTTRRPRATKAAEDAVMAAGNLVAACVAEVSSESTPAATGTQADAAVSASDPTQDDLKALAMKWRGTATDDATKAKQNELLVAIVAKIGAKKLSGPEGPTDPDQIRQAMFYIERASAGLPVDLNADYDFDGPIEQGVATAHEVVAEEDDPLG